MWCQVGDLPDIHILVCFVVTSRWDESLYDIDIQLFKVISKENFAKKDVYIG